MNAVIVIILALFTIVRGFPLEDHRDETNPELMGGYFEGDMVLDVKRNGLIDPAKRWPNNTVYYKIDENSFDAEHRDHILIAMRIIKLSSCIHFEDVTGTDKPYFVNITGHPDGCYSAVGWTNKTQTLNLQVKPLNKGCFRLGRIMHELLHTLGFYHMHSDSNRDKYVKIVKENIKDGFMSDFQKLEADVVDNFGQEYDYASIMHYNAYTHSKNGKKTIIALKNTTAASLMGQRGLPTNIDIRKLNAMYKCPKEDKSEFETEQDGKRKRKQIENENKILRNLSL